MSDRVTDLLTKALPGHVFLPGSVEYEEQQSTYYTSAQSDLLPRCRVSPRTADDVSVIVLILTANHCNFAVRSGGHMAWKGASNVGSTGVAVDLEKMNVVELSEDKKTVSIGSGCTWHDVYMALQSHNLTTVGGRSSDVGVGGFIMGGGVSFLSFEHGFGSDNVVNYQAVLADGSIVNANLRTNPDLYWALKLGSTNFGIVTRFDMETQPLGEMWGGSLFYDIALAPALLNNLVNVTNNLVNDPTVMTAVALVYVPAQSSYAIWAPTISLTPIAFPPILAALHKFTPTRSTVRFTNLIDITDEVRDTAPKTPGGRALWFSLTIKAGSDSGKLLYDIFTAGQKFFESSLQNEGFQWGVTTQPLNTTLIEASQVKNGGDPSGLSVEGGNLILLLGTVFWSNRTDDNTNTAKFEQYLKITEELARSRECLDRFIYMNYAYGGQDVYGGIGETNRKRMKQIQALYDPAGEFADHWKGGFKL